MSQAFDGPPPGHDVSRGRSYMTPLAWYAIIGGVGAVAIGAITYTMISSHRAPLVQSFHHDGGRPWALPALPTQAPAPPPTPPRAAPVAALPSPTAEPTVAPMGFWQDSSVVQRTAQGAARRDANEGDGSRMVDPAESLQDAGTTMQQHRAGLARASVGKPFNLPLLLRRGTTFHCVSEQPLDSDVPGPISCMVSDDVKSADGSVILIEKGSSVDGEVTRPPNIGTNRMFIEFDEILTLTGIPIYLSATGGDTLGTSGVDGTIDEHLWRRLKGALLLSAVEIGGNAVSNLSEKSGSLNLNVGTGQGESLASQMLQHDINIPPTLWRNQADPITVTVRQDIPMDEAYRLVSRAGAE